MVKSAPNHLTTGEFSEVSHGFLYHYYRAEVYRETNWRGRLDVTTNWSIVVTAGILSYSFGDMGTSHIVILINLLLVLIFLYMESRRFRYYNIIRKRVRLMEQYLFAPIFDGNVNTQTDSHWRTKLATSLNAPVIPMSKLEAIGWRLRRNYFGIIVLLFAVWISKISGMPRVSHSFWDIMANARVLIIPGEIVFATVSTGLTLLTLGAFIALKKTHVDDLP